MERAQFDREHNHIWIFVDETPEVAQNTATKVKWVEIFSRFGSRARHMHMHVVIVAQTETTMSLGTKGNAAIKETLTTVYTKRVAGQHIVEIVHGEDETTRKPLTWRVQVVYRLKELVDRGPASRPDAVFLTEDSLPQRTDEVLGDLLGTAPAVEEQRPTTLADRILDFLRERSDQGCIVRDIARAVDRGETQIRPILQRLAGQGQVKLSREDPTGKLSQSGAFSRTTSTRAKKARLKPDFSGVLVLLRDGAGGKTVDHKDFSAIDFDDSQIAAALTRAYARILSWPGLPPRDEYVIHLTRPQYSKAQALLHEMALRLRRS
jgi:hypothetical protein